ncbi:hypothetical protein BN2497_417 [Janthinobacterium sp. CG23_2]|nr:hypothetical protein BN2497_417 [Janthinobacterium sp. CG23_2]CUU26606.1 hypothetical protein BN3177_417 [Janthinobacterium sp. CG23_2]
MMCPACGSGHFAPVKIEGGLAARPNHTDMIALLNTKAD